MTAFRLILALLTPCTAFLALVPSVHSASNHSARLVNYENIRSCLLSWAVVRSQIISRDDLADSDAYKTLNWQWNALNGTQTPLMYVLATNAAQVAAAVRCGTTSRDIRVVAKSGGHSYAKHAFGDSDSLIVDLQLLDTVEVEVNSDGATATIGAGARQGKVLAELWAAGRWLLPAGNCPTVGLGGFVLGGGYGSYSRWLGLAADHLQEVTMVDASSAILTVNNLTNPELFWALHGGGGGNFGIVTSMKLGLRVAPNHVIQAVVTYSWNDFNAWFRSWQVWSSRSPPSHLVAVSLFNQTKIRTRFVSINGDQTELASIINTQFPPPESVISFDQFNYPEFVVNRARGYWPSDASVPLTDISQLVNLTRHNAPGWKRVKSMFVDHSLVTDEDISALKDLFLDFMLRHPDAQVSFEQQGGAIANVDSRETAYVHRGRTLFGVFLQVFSPGVHAQEPVGAVAAMERFYEETKLYWHHSTSYQNYLDTTLNDFLQRYYGDNLERLVAAKGSVDPDNVFHHTKSIPLRLP